MLKVNLDEFTSSVDNIKSSCSLFVASFLSFVPLPSTFHENMFSRLNEQIISLSEIFLSAKLSKSSKHDHKLIQIDIIFDF